MENRMLLPGDDPDKKRKIKWSTEPYLSIMKRAVELAMQGSSTTKVASEFTIPARTLRRYVAAKKRANGNGSHNMANKPRTGGLAHGGGQANKAKQNRNVRTAKTVKTRKNNPHLQRRGKPTKVRRPVPGAQHRSAQGLNGQGANRRNSMSAPDTTNPFARENLPGRQKSTPPRSSPDAESRQMFSGFSQNAWDDFSDGQLDGEPLFDNSGYGNANTSMWKRNRFPSAGSSEGLHDSSRLRLRSASNVSIGSIGDNSMWFPVALPVEESSGVSMAQPSLEQTHAGNHVRMHPSNNTGARRQRQLSGSIHPAFPWNEPSHIVAQIGHKGDAFGNPSRRLRAESIDLFRQAFESMPDSRSRTCSLQFSNGTGGAPPTVNKRKESIELFLNALTSSE